MKNPRIEITITKSDKDIEKFLKESEIANATLFKIAMRAYMQQKEDEKLDERIKRLLEETISKFATTIATPIDDTPKIENEVSVKAPPKKLNFNVKQF